MTFEVKYLPAARADLTRLFDHLLERATTAEDLARAGVAYEAILQAVDSLRRNPFLYRKAGDSPFVRELLIPFGAGGYVALFEVVNERLVHVLAVRHQREDDYH